MFLDRLLEIVTKVSDYLWWPAIVIMILAVGIGLTVMMKFLQVSRLGAAVRLVLLGAFKKDKSKNKIGDITPFQALMTALAATVGNGNIAGVATAIATGGPGAPFWMWFSGFFGMATKYSEGYLGVRFRKIAEDGSIAGGPIYYIRYGLGDKPITRFLATAFAVCGGLAALIGTGNMMQANSITLSAVTQLHQYHIVPNDVTFLPSLSFGVFLALLTGLVTIGGIKRIGAVSEKLVPSMIVFYFIGASIIIITNITEIPAAFWLIIKSAFSFKAAVGGVIGVTIRDAMRHGIAKGVLSNEAGLGSASIAQSASKTDSPSHMGLVAMTGVLIDTLIVNTFTTLTIVLTGAWIHTKAANFAGKQLESIQLTQYAWDSVIPGGGLAIIFASFLFGFTTLIGWSYYGEQCFEYLFGLKIVKPYRFVFVLLIVLGALFQGKYVPIIWYIGDIGNAFMAFPNLVGLIFLSTIVARETRKELLGKKAVKLI